MDDGQDVAAPGTSSSQGKITKGRKRRAVKRPTREKDIGFVRQKMVDWFDPGQLIQTAARAFISSIFGSYSDKRELQSVLDARFVLRKEAGNGKGESDPSVGERRVGDTVYWDYSDRETLWVDYVADTGDGWNSTYTIASLLAQSSLRPAGVDEDLPRGEVLIMGGDQVYPTASREEYNNRLVGPYRAALPALEDGEDPPRLFSIPGNHDWYDGLTHFMRIYCQEEYLGAWRTPQSRSYFAIKLPGSCWLWGADFQLESDIDLPQKEYFASIAHEVMKPGDRIVLCIPEPSWVYTASEGRPIGSNLSDLIEEVSEDPGCRFDLWLAGDLHHYARYSAGPGGGHRITAGGGGAFLHPTHLLPKELDLEDWNAQEGATTKQNYRCEKVFPTRSRSRGRTWGNLLFPFRNFSFCTLLGSFYFMMGWAIRRAVKATSIVSEGPLADVVRIIESFHDTEAGSLGSELEDVTELLELPTVVEAFHRFHDAETTFWENELEYVTTLLQSPIVLALGVMLVLGFVAFTMAFSGHRSKLGSAWAGVAHGLTHIVLMGFLFWYYGMMIHDYEFLQPVSSRIVLYPVFMLLVGGFLGGSLMGIYLLLTNLLLGWHGNESFSSMAYEEYKNFLRMRFSSDGVTIYPIGVRRVEKHWKFDPGSAPSDPYFLPAGSTPLNQRTRLLEEKPITLQ